MTEKGMTPQEFIAIGEKLKKTSEDPTPFAIVEEDKISVVGDANKTETKAGDYQVKFRMPKEFFGEAPQGAKSVDKYYVFSVEYKDITITPRSDLKIVDAIMKVLPFFHNLREDGGVEELSQEELLSRYIHAGDGVHLAIYNLVAAFLGIDDVMGEYMLPFSVISALNKIIERHPEIFNEADVFFG